GHALVGLPSRRPLPAAYRSASIAPSPLRHLPRAGPGPRRQGDLLGALPQSAVSRDPKVARRGCRCCSPRPERSSNVLHVGYATVLALPPSWSWTSKCCPSLVKHISAHGARHGHAASVLPVPGAIPRPPTGGHHASRCVRHHASMHTARFVGAWRNVPRSR